MPNFPSNPRASAATALVNCGGATFRRGGKGVGGGTATYTGCEGVGARALVPGRSVEPQPTIASATALNPIHGTALRIINRLHWHSTPVTL